MLVAKFFCYMPPRPLATLRCKLFLYRGNALRTCHSCVPIFLKACEPISGKGGEVARCVLKALLFSAAGGKVLRDKLFFTLATFMPPCRSKTVSPSLFDL